MSGKSGQWSVVSGKSVLRALYVSLILIVFSCTLLSLTPYPLSLTPYPLSLTPYPLPLTTSYSLICKVPLDGGSFTTDNLQNIYVYRNNSIKKYSSSGKQMYAYSEKSYGAISSIDVNDPLKMLVFYKDIPEIILLDNTLSQNGSPFSPTTIGYSLATLACTSHDDGIWMYDAQNFQLIRLDVNLNVVQQTGNIAQNMGISLNPQYITEYNNFVYLNDTAQGLIVFDSFGAYYKTIPLKNLSSFQIRGDDMFYVSKNRIHTFHLKTIMEDVTMAPDTLATEVRIEKNIFYEKYKDTVRVFEVKN
jgi:hypothetical protein